MIYYRGAKSSTFGKGSWDGIWVTRNPKNAAQYGKIWIYQTLHKLNLMNFNTERAMKQFGKRYCTIWPKEEFNVHQSDDYAELYMFPPESFSKFLRWKDFDGYNFGNTTFIVDPQKKLKFIGAYK